MSLCLSLEMTNCMLSILCTEKEQKRRWKEAKLIRQLEKQNQTKEEEVKQQQSQEEEEKTKGILTPLGKNELGMLFP